ncbi:MAG TPA: RDD family protein [Dinghuibacter sp.]|uniref:RDD family protein n=1 Tax=Dinghuibacter sp. TaxID=2024697 RepID=UPI002C64E23D|nr:RDD family protein [Dinghuibacter sp.]HTJ10504.1 RDD family protein [Dinghuibacter sp.]
MSSIRIPTSFNIDLEFDIPEFHRRLLALIIDWAILIVYVYLAVKVFQAIIPSAHNESSVAFDVAVLLALIPFFLYFLLTEVWMNGQSLGKKVMRMRVVNMNGGKPTLGQFVIRWLLRPVDFGITFCVGGLLSVIFSKYSQRLGDLAAGTILISTNTRAALEETIFMETAQNYVPQFPQVMRLSDRDLNTIRSLLERAKGNDHFHIAATAAEKIRTVLKIDTPMAPYEFLETLLKDYNHISVQ